MQWVIVILALVIVELNPGQKATVLWTPGDDLYEWHMVRGIWLDLTPEETTGWIKIDKPINEWEAVRFRSGHFAIEVKPCMEENGEPKCAPAIRSDIDGKPKPWIIFWKPPKPTGFIVEDY